jgi:hypothetical protein
MRLIAVALLAAAASYGAAPDFNGNWKLNSAKSEFGQFPAPGGMTQKVAHAEPKLSVQVKMASDQGEFEFSSNYTTDGKECTNPGFGGAETKSTAKWDGESLVIETKGAFGDNAYTMKDKWTLSEGGKVLTVQRHFAGGMGEMDQKMVFEKQ